MIYGSIFLILTGVLLSGCDRGGDSGTVTEAITEIRESVSESGTTEPVEKERISLFADPTFQKGLWYSLREVALPAGRFNFCYAVPKWQYSQEGSWYDIGKDSVYSSPEAGVHIYEDPAKYLYIDTNTGSFRLGMNTKKEFVPDRPSGWPSPGVLMTPTMTHDRYIKDMENLYVTLDFVLDKSDILMSEEEFDSNRHTAQWNFYVFVQDRDSTSWYYVGLPLYDYRGTGQTKYIAGDVGTNGTMIYIPSAKEAYGEYKTVKVGERFTVTVDLLPFIKDAYRAGTVRGYLRNVNLNNCYISGCNLGWEIPGSFDCLATVYRFDLAYTEK